MTICTCCGLRTPTPKSFGWSVIPALGWRCKVCGDPKHGAELYAERLATGSDHQQRLWRGMFAARQDALAPATITTDSGEVLTFWTDDENRANEAVLYGECPECGYPLRPRHICPPEWTI